MTSNSNNCSRTGLAPNFGRPGGNRTRFKSRPSPFLLRGLRRGSATGGALRLFWRYIPWCCRWLLQDECHCVCELEMPTMTNISRPRGVTASTLDSESSDRASNPREAYSFPNQMLRCHHHSSKMTSVRLFQARCSDDQRPAAAAAAATAAVLTATVRFPVFCTKRAPARCHRALPFGIGRVPFY